MEAVGAGDDERAFACGGRCEVRQKQPSISVRRCAAKEIVRAGKGAASEGSEKKLTSRPQFHVQNLLEIRKALYNIRGWS
jgi:hypothetical protein